MPRRKFVYGSGGVVEVTPEESRALCAELSEDAAQNREPLEFGLPRSRSQWRNAAGCWPMASDSFGCSDPEAVRDEQKLLAEHGVKTEYDAEHRPIFTGRAHKKAHLRAIGYADPDAGYGDAEPVNYTSDLKRQDVTNPAVRQRRYKESLERLQNSERRLFGQVLTHH